MYKHLTLDELVLATSRGHTVTHMSIDRDSKVPPLNKIAPNLKHLQLFNPDTTKDQPDR